MMFDITNIVDTLRYFYSAVFQGFAAIIALGSMFYLYFRQMIVNEKNNIENELFQQKYFNLNDKAIQYKKDEIGIVEMAREEINRHKKEQSTRFIGLGALLMRYDYLTVRLREIEPRISPILRNTILILLASMCALFLVDYWSVINYVLIGVGVILIAFSIYNLWSIKNLILKILKD